MSTSLQNNQPSRRLILTDDFSVGDDLEYSDGSIKKVADSVVFDEIDDDSGYEDTHYADMFLVADDGLLHVIQ